MVVADAKLDGRQDRRRREQQPQPGRRPAADRELPKPAEPEPIGLV
jgi:hypothetical protein